VRVLNGEGSERERKIHSAWAYCSLAVIAPPVSGAEVPEACQPSYYHAACQYEAQSRGSGCRFLRGFGCRLSYTERTLGASAHKCPQKLCSCHRTWGREEAQASSLFCPYTSGRNSIKTPYDVYA